MMTATHKPLGFFALLPWIVVGALGTACDPEGVVDKLGDTDTDTLTDSDSDPGSETDTDDDTEDDTLVVGDPCEEDPCGAHGTCEPDGAEFTCDCEDGYVGDLCETCPPGAPCDDVPFYLEGDFTHDERLELFVGSTGTGGVATRIVGPFGLYGSVRWWDLAADGINLVYTANQEEGLSTEVYVVGRRGGGTQVVSAPMVPGGDASPGVRTTAAGRLVYVANADDDTRREIYGTNLSGGPVKKLNHALGGAGQVDVWEVALLSPDGLWVAYAGTTAAKGPYRLYITPVDGSAPAKPITPRTIDDDARFYNIQFTPDSRKVVFSAHLVDRNDGEAYVVDRDGATPPLILHKPVVATQGVGPMDVSPDGRWVLIGGTLESTKSEIFIVPIDASAPPLRLNPYVPKDGQLQGGEFSPDGRHVLYQARFSNAAEDFSLYAVPVSGGAPWRLSDPGVLDSKITSELRFSPDGQWVAYTADPTEYSQRNLYVARIDGSVAPRRVHSALPPDSDIEDDFQFTPDGASLVFRLRHFGETATTSLWVADLDGANERLLSPAVVEGRTVTRFAVSPSGNWLVYTEDRDTRHLHEAYVVPMNGSAAPRKVSPPLSGALDVTGVRFAQGI